MNLRIFAHHALSLSLGLFLLPTALAAGDAVVVNANGTTQFNYTVSGPNVLGTAAPVPITGTTTLDATAAGKFYTISGTADYTITLPLATAIPGSVIGLRVSNAASMVYSIVAPIGQSLDEYTNPTPLPLIHGNYIEVVSIGGNWISRVKTLDSPVYVQASSAAGQATVNGTTNLQYETEAHDNYKSWSGTEFTAPMRGIYSVSACASYNSSSNNDGNLLIFVNNAQVVHGTRYTRDNSVSAMLSVSGAVVLSRGDKLSIRRNLNNGTRVTNPGANYLSIVRVGSP